MFRKHANRNAPSSTAHLRLRLPNGEEVALEDPTLPIDKKKDNDD